MAKRAFDIFFSVLGLLVLSPAILVIPILIALDDSGSVLFRQERVGRYGSRFWILKFRTMTDDPFATGPLVTSDRDVRITRFGKVLRVTKLDELPQLINVLAGDMSIVGPRPEVPRYVEFYPADVREKVLSVRPGITDEAAIEFRDESAILSNAADSEMTYLQDILPRKLALYEKYVDSQSLALDVTIIFRTLWAIVDRRSDEI